MKAKPETVAAIRAAIEPWDTLANRAAYQARGLSPVRYAFDLLHASKFDTAPLYREPFRGGEGLADAHIETAILSILNLKRTGWQQ